MNFPVGAFAKIDNLSKMCNLDNSFNNPKEKEKSQIYVKIQSYTQGISYLFFSLFSLKNNLAYQQSKQER